MADIDQSLLQSAVPAIYSPSYVPSVGVRSNANEVTPALDQEQAYKDFTVPTLDLPGSAGTGFRPTHMLCNSMRLE